MRRLAVTGLKGGVGKTTLAHNVAVALARRGRRVLAVDLDPQHSLTTATGVSPDATAGAAALFDANGPDPMDLAVKVEDRRALIPASWSLTAAEHALTGGRVRREERLRRRLDGLRGFDFALADCGPGLTGRLNGLDRPPNP